MKVHLYAQCWNDADFLPFFFRHYDAIVDRYVLFDDGSTDGTRQILIAHPKVEMRDFPRIPGSFVLSEMALSNACWKESIGTADWVIVTDIDEFLYHQDLRAYLLKCRKSGTSLVPALGFQMIAETYPSAEDNLSQTIRYGAPWPQMMKASIFDPNRISEINYSPGRHRAKPEGEVETPDRTEILLFHYKYLGFEETHQRHLLLYSGLKELDHKNYWGHKYSWSKDELRADWEAVRQQAIDTTRVDSVIKDYPYMPWWFDHLTSNVVPKRPTENSKGECIKLNTLDIVISNAMQVQGWRKAEECLEIARVACELPDNPVIVEIGVFMGRSSILLAGARAQTGRGGAVHCIDPFDCSGDEFSMPHYQRMLVETGSISLEEIFRHNVNKFGVGDMITVHATTSREAAKVWSSPINLLLLDGDQSVEGARESFENWTPFLKPGGTIVIGNSPVGKTTPGHNGNRLLVDTEIKPSKYTNVRQFGSTVIATKG